MFILARALTYATLFIGFVLVFLPARVLAWSGIGAPSRFGLLQVAGGAVTAAGAMLAVTCVVTFAFVGKGTPAPFDPPRRLVVRGPYRWLRNPMYLGAAVALAGAALFYQSIALLGFTMGFVAVTHLFVVWYEEPVLSDTFGAEYHAYRARVGRWWPRRTDGGAA